MRGTTYALVSALAALTTTLAGCDSTGPAECVGEACLDGPRCETDADCDDGLICNGAEVCGSVSRRCVDGIPLDCDDGIACTVDVCGEPDGTCSSAPDDLRCQPGEECSGIEGTGCIRSCDAGVACDPISACGCLAGQACTYRRSGAPSCGAAGAGMHGAPCSTNADCAAGTQCIPLDGSAGLPATYAECRALCRGAADCPSREACGVRLAGVAGTSACVRGCELVTQTGCAGPAGCHPVGFEEGRAPVADCVVRGDVPVGGSCATAGAVCRAGLLCVNHGEGIGVFCDRICRFDRDCPGTQDCVDLAEPVRVGSVEYGVCI